MANASHLEQLHKGVAAWNAWRGQNPGVCPDLTEQVIDGEALGLTGPVALNLSGADLSQATLRQIDIAVELHDLKLFKATLSDVQFFGTLSRIDFRRSNLEQVSFEDVTLSDCAFNGATMRETRFQRAKLLASETRPDAAEDASVHDEAVRDDARQSLHMSLEGSVLLQCDWRDAELNETDLRGAGFENCDLRGVKGLVLDDNILRGSLMSPGAKDPWSEMRRRYTGANMIFILLASLLFFLPWIVAGAGWLIGSEIEARWVTSFPVGQQGGERGAMVARAGACLAADDGAGPDGRCRPLWQLLLGWHEGWWSVLTSGLLLLYNGIRLGLTWLVAPMRDEELQSFHTPAFASVASTARRKIQGLRTHYGWMVPWHKTAKLLFYLSFSLGVLNLLGRLSTPVWLPEL